MRLKNSYINSSGDKKSRMRNKIDHEVLESLDLFMKKLNDESENDSLLVVEGKNDARALISLGFKGDLFLLCNKSLAKLRDEADKYKKIILLLDLDRKGGALTRKSILILQGQKKKIDLFYRKKIQKVTKGRIKQIEHLIQFKDYSNINLQ
jgi:5S rRNA maturation endonuclease (ribonuclease M5)